MPDIRTPQRGDALNYWPSPRAPQGPGGHLPVEDSSKPFVAVVVRVHSERLVDILIPINNDENTVRISFVPLVHPDDPDPQTLTGRCEWPT